MKQSGVFIPAAETGKQCPADQLLTRSGYIQETSDGMYAYFPLAGKVLENMKQVIRAELEQAGMLEIDLPYEQFGHASGKSDEMILLSFIAKEVISSAQLPISVFHMKQQIRTGSSFDPEKGLLSAKEFSLMSGYSFHTDTREAGEHGAMLRSVFSDIFNLIGMPFTVLASEDPDGAEQYGFAAYASCGDTWIARNESGTYAADWELAEARREGRDPDRKQKPAEKVPGAGRDAERLAVSLGLAPDSVICSFLYEADAEPVLVLIQNGCQLNERKLKRALGVTSLRRLTDGHVKEVLGAEAQTLGPVQLPFGFRVVADWSVETVINGLCGANETDTFLVNVNPERDFTVDLYADIRQVAEGEPSPDGNGTLSLRKAITFARVLGPKPVFSKIDVSGREPLEITTGYYYIDMTRLFAAAAEHYSDESGLKWPVRLAPYDVHLLIQDAEDESQRELAEELNSVIKGYRYRVLYDDRPVSGESKQLTSDRLGIPVKLTVDARAAEGMVEVSYRSTGASLQWRKEEVTEKLQEFFRMG